MSHHHVALIAASLGIGCLSGSLASAGTWIGGDGDWDTPTNWNPNFVPGTNLTPNSNEDFRILNGSAVTVSTDTSGNAKQAPPNEAVNAWRDLLVNANPAPSSSSDGTSLTVISTGILAVPRSFGVGMGATLNLNGGQITSGGASFGDGRGGAIAYGPATVSVTGGTFTASAITFGSQGGYAVGTMSDGTLTTAPNGSMSIGSGVLDETLTGSISSFTQTGGTLIQPRGISTGRGHTGVYNLGDNGVLQITDGSSIEKGMRIGVSSEGIFNMTGGTATVARLQVGPTTVSSGNGTVDGVGVVAISGGAYNGSNLAVGGSDEIGTGTLRITGSDAAITLSKGAGPGAFRSFANGTLNFQIASDGVSTIIANNTQPDGRSLINLAGTLDLDLIGGFVPSEGQTFTLLTTNNVAPYYEEGHNGDAEFLVGQGMIIDAGTYSASNSSTHVNTGLSLAAADVASWTFGVVELDENAGHALVATYVPEPGSLALLGLVLPALTMRRRQGRTAN